MNPPGGDEKIFPGAPSRARPFRARKEDAMTCPALSAFFASLCLLAALPRGDALEVASPGGELVLSFQVKDWGGMRACPVYRLSWKGKPLLAEAALGLRLQGAPSLEEGFRILSVRRWTRDQTWVPVWGERSRIRDHFNALTVTLGRPGSDRAVLEIEFRLFHGAAAFRYRLLGKGSVRIERETSRFRFFADHPCWATGFARAATGRSPSPR